MTRFAELGRRGLLYVLLLQLGAMSLAWNVLATLLHPLLPERRATQIGRAVIARAYRSFWATAHACGMLQIEASALDALHGEPGDQRDAGPEAVERAINRARALGEHHQLCTLAQTADGAAHHGVRRVVADVAGETRAGAEEDVVHQVGLHDANAARQARHQHERVPPAADARTLLHELERYFARELRAPSVAEGHAVESLT